MLRKTTKKRIGRPADVAPVFRTILDAEGELDQAKEHFWAMFLDTQGHILRVELITLGLLDQTIVHPREVFRPAIGCAAKSVILCHNHPSGDPKPSDKDIHDLGAADGPDFQAGNGGASRPVRHAVPLGIPILVASLPRGLRLVPVPFADAERLATMAGMDCFSRSCLPRAGVAARQSGQFDAADKPKKPGKSGP